MSSQQPPCIIDLLQDISTSLAKIVKLLETGIPVYTVKEKKTDGK